MSFLFSYKWKYRLPNRPAGIVVVLFRLLQLTIPVKKMDDNERAAMAEALNETMKTINAISINVETLNKRVDELERQLASFVAGTESGKS